MCISADGFVSNTIRCALLNLCMMHSILQYVVNLSNFSRLLHIVCKVCVKSMCYLCTVI